MSENEMRLLRKHLLPKFLEKQARLLEEYAEIKGTNQDAHWDHEDAFKEEDFILRRLRISSEIIRKVMPFEEDGND